MNASLLPEAPTPWIVAGIVIVCSAALLILCWHLWVPPRAPVEDPVERWRRSFEQNLPPVPTNAEVKDDGLWPWPTWRVHERPFDWRID